MSSLQTNNACLIVGGTGTGKTTFVKERLNRVDKNALHLYDVNNEYSDYYDKPLKDFESFLNDATKLRRACIVFEEATIFFSNKTSNRKITELLVRKRHTQNTVFLVFHSFRAIPRNIIDLVNYFIIFKTKDAESIVQSKFNDDDLTKVFNEVKDSSNQHIYKVFKTS